MIGVEVCWMLDVGCGCEAWCSWIWGDARLTRGSGGEYGGRF